MTEMYTDYSTVHSSNTLMNFSSKTTQASTESLEFKYTKVTFYFVILFCSTFGNSMVVYVICTSRKMKNGSHVLIMNLAVCDFFTPLISIPFDFALEENKYAWFYGDFLCKILYPAATFSTTVSSLTLAAISLDRYRLIMHPFKKKLSSKQIKGIIIGIYIFSGIIVSPYTYALGVSDNECVEHGWTSLYRKVYTMTLFLVQYAAPLVFMTVMYTLAVINLYATSGKVRHCSIQGSNTTRVVHNPNAKSRMKRVILKMNPFGKSSDSAEENPNVRATKMFMTVVAVFAIFMFPNQLIWLYAEFGKVQNNAQVRIICWLFTYTNSVVNPVIFAIFSKEFRMGFKGVFQLVFCCNHKALPDQCRTAHSRIDSSANEIFKDKDKKYGLANEICDTNTTFDDTLTRIDSKYSIRLLDIQDLNGNSGFNERVKDFPLCGTRAVLKASPLCNSGEPKERNPDSQTSQNPSTESMSPVKLEVNELNSKLMAYKETFQSVNFLPVLPPNSVAILSDLPETNC